MNRVQRTFNVWGGRLMARSGSVAILATTGAKTGKRRTVPVGIMPLPDGTVVIAAGGDGRGWTANLRADPRCTLDLKGGRRTYEATQLAGEERDAAAADFSTAMGRLTRGAIWTDVFVLRPTDSVAAASEAP
jgi:deazaflavin-dependent oxidoreductase (nitroreductase family)